MSQDSSHLVFVYGTLKRGEPNHEVMGDKGNGSINFVGSGQTVHKYPLVVFTEYNVPFLINLENEGHNIRGEVYEVDNKMLAFLDEFEGVPKLYQRHETTVQVTEDKDGNALSSPQIKKCGTYFVSSVREDMLPLKWLSDYHSVSDDHPEYVKRCKRTKLILDLVFPKE